MSWDKPGSGGNNPWGPRGGRQGPPDLDKVVKNVQERIGSILGGKGGGGGGRTSAGGPQGSTVALIVILVLLGAWIYKSVYQIPSGWEGIELRFGRYSESTGPGLNWLFWPVESVVQVNRERVRTVEVGYRSTDVQNQVQSTVGKEALMLTKDENIVDLRLAVQYDIKDAKLLVFNVADPSDIVVRGATESVLREVVGTSGMDFVLTEGRKEVAARTKQLLQTILDRYKTGINVISVEMQDAQPPKEVKPAFDDAVKAREDQETLKNKAEAYRNDILPKAKGQAARIRQEAEGYKQSVIAEAQGEAARFVQVLNEYRKAPEITRTRLYLETMEQVLSSSGKLLIDQSTSNNIMFLPLDQLFKQGRIVKPPLSPDADTGVPDESKDAQGSRNSRGRVGLRERSIVR